MNSAEAKSGFEELDDQIGMFAGGKGTKRKRRMKRSRNNFRQPLHSQLIRQGSNRLLDWTSWTQMDEQKGRSFNRWWTRGFAPRAKSGAEAPRGDILLLASGD
jgi:hypothetical protein